VDPVDGDLHPLREQPAKPAVERSIGRGRAAAPA
jgi:hypothetical protein